LTKKCAEDHVPVFEMILEVPKEYQAFMGKTTTRLVCLQCHNEKPWYTQFSLSERSIQ